MSKLVIFTVAQGRATIIRDNTVDSTVCKRHASVLHARRKRNWQLLDATTTGDVHDHDSTRAVEFAQRNERRRRKADDRPAIIVSSSILKSNGIYRSSLVKGMGGYLTDRMDTLFWYNSVKI